MPKSAASSTSDGSSSYASSFTASSVADLPGEKKLDSENRDDTEDIWERSQGLFDDIYGAVYLAQTPHEQALSVKKGMASSLIQSVQLLFLLLSPYAGLFAPDQQLWVYRYFSWVVFKIPLMELKSYILYVVAVYVLLGLGLVTVGSTAWMSFKIKNDEQERRKYKKVLGAVRPVAGLLFLVFPIAIMDLCSGVFMCTWEDWPNPVPLLWDTSHGTCVSGQHVIHASVAAGTFVLYAFVSVLMGIGTCEQNPVSGHMSSSPNLQARCKIVLIKVGLVLCASQLTSEHKWQAGLCLWLSLWAFWINFRQVPYYRAQTNYLHCGLWLGMGYIAALGVAGATMMAQGLPEQLVKANLTWWAGVFIMPVGITGIILGRVRQIVVKGDLARIAAAPIGAKPHKVLHLQGRWHFELLSRCVRVNRNIVTGQLDPESMALAETVLQFGAAKYGKEDPFMVTLQAAFSIFVHRDLQQARMQLQLVSRSGMGPLQAYGQFCCGEYIKATKDAGDGGLDLASYVTFNRSYRCAVRAHRAALQAQRAFWRLLVSERVRYADLEDVLTTMGEAERHATQVYRRVVERYPSNAKLLKAYGRFVEEVQHDPWRANKYYSEAEKQGSSDSNVNLSTMIKSMEGSGDSILADLDERKHGIIIINSAGIIMTSNPAVCSMFGYSRSELEGRNVAMIVPQPYAQRHNDYIQRYITTGTPHILGASQRLMGLHKDHCMVPLTLHVSRLSGTGADSVFLGVLKPYISGADSLDVWALPKTGVVLCVDPRFPDHYGYASSEVTGRPLSKLVTQSSIAAFDK